MGRACAEEVTRWTATAIGLANGEARRLAGSRQPSTKRGPAERDPKGNRAPTFTRRYEFSATLITLTFRIATRKKRWLAPTRGRCQPPVAVAAICYCCDVVGRRAPAPPAPGPAADLPELRPLIHLLRLVKQTKTNTITTNTRSSQPEDD